MNDFTIPLLAVKVMYSPLLGDEQVLANKSDRSVLCGYSAHFNIMYKFGSLNDAVDWAESLAKENLKDFINNKAKHYLK